MKRNKILALAITASLGFIGADAMACSTAAWNGGEQNNPTEGEPNTAGGNIKRYAGRCGLKATAAGQTVTDNSPSAETTYRMQGYFFPSITGGEAVLFRATSADAGGGTDIIRVSQNGSTLNFYANPNPTPVAVAITPNRWYQVQLNWSSSGTMGIHVRGNGSDTPVISNLESGQSFTGLANSADRIGSAVVGFGSTISGSPVGSVEVDAFESRRSTAIPRACRGDANNDGARNTTDGSQARLEFLSAGATLATGFPDASEDGAVNTTDGSQTRLLFLGGNGPCPAPAP